MRGNETLEIIKDLGGDLPKAENAIFNALVDDTKKMDERMSALEKSVGEVKADVKDIKEDIKTLSEKVQTLIEKKSRLLIFATELIKQPKFWIWLTVLTLLIFGITEADVFSFLKS